ncbi:hypothetical protein GWK87_06915 [Staphylococcus schleiferi subsp. coagulans]|uniref:hypothetical protein n=1 Tax=Staphylococcus coagulans TaxID=74706 RepID=UPI0015FC501B|nr:hypothetical protein [Staphylococcus coagulans]MBA8760027.1 hypothetical protein [Staphylococcus coagulans]MBA8768534.1 hypothetical protein [Staphylococcus coagulans]
MLKMFSVLSTSLTLLLMPMVFAPTAYARSLFSRPLPSSTIAQATPKMMLVIHDEKDSPHQDATETKHPQLKALIKNNRISHCLLFITPMLINI